MKRPFSCTVAPFLVLILILLITPNNGFTISGNTEIRSVNYAEHFDNEAKSKVNSSIFKTAKKYFCLLDKIGDPEIIIYGTKSWAFPAQDVNLTLSYPTLEQMDNADNRYNITGFNVILFVDNPETQGFITSGGILQDSISLTFMCTNVSMLVYEFWLFGVRSDNTQFTTYGPITDLYDVC